MTKELWPVHGAEALRDVSEVIKSPDLGAVNIHLWIQRLEHSFVARQGGGLAAFFNSGTSAYSAALFALDLPVGSEVIIPDISFRATATPLLSFGLTPVFVRCQELGGIDSSEITSAITGKTKAILVNHQWGVPVDIDTIISIADKYNLKVIEDVSHAHGGTYKEKPLGTFGHISYFSCGTTKLVSGGLGGLLYTKDKNLYQKAILYGQGKHRCLTEVFDTKLKPVASLGVGVNLRGHPVAAVLAYHHFNSIDDLIDLKNKNIETLDEVIKHHAPEMQAMRRPYYWTSGTWYKRPYKFKDKASRDRWSDIALRNGLLIEKCEYSLSELFGPAYDSNSVASTSGRFNFDFVPATQNSEVDSLLLFNTRDLLFGSVDWDDYRNLIMTTHRQFAEIANEK